MQPSDLVLLPPKTHSGGFLNSEKTDAHIHRLRQDKSLKFCHSASFRATKMLLYEKFIRIQPGI